MDGASNDSKGGSATPSGAGALERDHAHGMAGAMARAGIRSKLTPLLAIASVIAGIAAVILLPREEEPQIKVPMVDVLVRMPGASVREIAERVSRPMEKLLWEIPGVEYVYTTSSPGQSLAVVRFKVGEEIESSIVKLNHKLQSNYNRIPLGVQEPLIRMRGIDDVPIMALTFHSSRYDHHDLRRIAAQVDDAVKRVPNVAETTLIGGFRRHIRVLLDPSRLAARELSPLGVATLLQQANRQSIAGDATAANREVLIESGAFLYSAEDTAGVVVGVFAGRPVFLREVAEILDGPEDPRHYVYHGVRDDNAPEGWREEPAVTLTVAKRPGANAIAVSHAVIGQVEGLRGYSLPDDVQMTVTRDYGETAAEKSNELLFHMAIAVFSVSLLILWMLGWRESLIVAIAIPSTLGLTLLVFLLYGYTLNRITLFALIFSIGILVDDAIVVVENIQRHLHLPQNKRRSIWHVSVEAVAEVGNPTILATLAVIAAILPMAFVGGLMGPYMRPIPIGASAAMIFSLFIAFLVTPWAAARLLGGKKEHSDHTEDWFTRLYRRFMGPLLSHPAWRWAFLGFLAVLLLAACALVPLGFVKVKMLPFDNKSELQVILNMPEGSSLEETLRVAREMGESLRREPEVENYQIYAGTAAPFNFNGLVRHYFMRSGAYVADIQVNFVPKHARKAQSHDLALRIRPALAEIASRNGARMAVAEVPPGPPVLQTLVAEVYAADDDERLALAEKVREIFKTTPGVVDVDWYVEEPQEKALFVIDKAKAALNGVSAETIARTLEIATDGASIDLVHQPREREDVVLRLELPETMRGRAEDLLALRVRPGDANALAEPGAVARDGTQLVPLRELVRIERAERERSVYHKNLMPVTYVIGDVAGEAESPVYVILAMNKRLAELDAADYGGQTGPIRLYNATQPIDETEPAIKWDGEWHITIEVFRDLGIAFAAVLVLVYALMVGWFKSFLTPLIVMAAIPFSLVGILPAHGAMDAFFSATSMIGFMAGAGIVVRNSIILVDFIEQRLREGEPLDRAVVDAGAIRFRPMLLTALAVVVGASVILADPIFQGLAISLMAGEIASLLLSRMAVPVLYYMAYKRKAA